MLDSLHYNYGYGLFETIKVVNGKPIFMKEHLERLLKGCEYFNIPTPLELNFDTNDIQNGILKVIISDLGVSYNIKKMYEIPKRPYILGISNLKRHSTDFMNYYKTLNYMSKLYDLKSSNLDEIIYLNERNNICEGTKTNIFFIKENVVYTPNIESGLLNGIMRKKTIELLNSKGIIVFEREININILYEFDSCFITNSLIGIKEVLSIDSKQFNVENNIMSMLKEVFNYG
jgi:4-amino-4-deoxychorismate lyase